MPWAPTLRTDVLFYTPNDMDLVCFKVALLAYSWLIAEGSPVAMLQHPTSSQSIVFHPQAAGTSAIAGSGASDQYANTPPKYEYKYEVSDHQTGDRKSHWETREGDRVRGAYTLYEPDGALRTVEYTADALHGFNAVVRRDEPKRSGFNSYNPASNSVSDGYDTSSSQPRYPPRNTLSSSQGFQESTGSSGYSQTYKVDHGFAPRAEPVKPY